MIQVLLGCAAGCAMAHAGAPDWAALGFGAAVFWVTLGSWF